ncbi:MAG: hypothetical protein K2O65_14710 [Lachnospiraceae bacterium]|nr:hypothetical protein [Lachnospiraceae bacterium]
MNKENNAKLYKIELNDMGDHIDISTGDTELFDRFRETYKQIADAAKDLPRRCEEIDKVRAIPGHENKIVEKIWINVRFCKESAEKIDDIFGQGTLKKYFRSLYEKIPDFVPEANCFIDFYDQMIPVLEKLFGRKVDDSEKERIRSMGKYVNFYGQTPGGDKVVPNRRKRYGKKH